MDCSRRRRVRSRSRWLACGSCACECAGSCHGRAVAPRLGSRRTCRRRVRSSRRRRSTALDATCRRCYETNEATQDLVVLDRLLRRHSRHVPAPKKRSSGAGSNRARRSCRAPGRPKANRGQRSSTCAPGAPLVRWSAEQGMVQARRDGERNADARGRAGARARVGVRRVSVSRAPGARGSTATPREPGCRASRRRWRASSSCSTCGATTDGKCVRAARCSTQSSAYRDIETPKHWRRRSATPRATSRPHRRRVSCGGMPGEGHGVVQAIVRASEIEPGFHVTAESMVGRACVEQLPLHARGRPLAATAEACPYGGFTRPIGSVAVIPVIGSADDAIGALVVEGKDRRRHRPA